MLIEAFLHATAETSRPLRRLGLVGDAVALWSRATRRRGAWAPHEARCRALVERSLSGLAPGGTVAVLGSGLLRDVPLDLLARRFDRVVLVDAVHLWPARRRSRRPGIERRVADLTGLAGPLTGEGAADDWVAGLAADGSLRLAVSACVLSQLPFAPRRWVERHPGSLARADSLAGAGSPAGAGLPVPEPGLPARLIRRHLADLSRLPARICLLTDIGYAHMRRDGTREDAVDLLHGIGLPPPDDAWDWQVAPPGEIDRHLSHVHRVHGYCAFPHRRLADPDADTFDRRRDHGVA